MNLTASEGGQRVCTVTLMPLFLGFTKLPFSLLRLSPKYLTVDMESAQWIEPFAAFPSCCLRLRG